MAKRDRARLAAVLSADSQLYFGTDASSILNSHPYESSYAFGVKNLKGIVC
jgi:hypothetical protein